MPFSRVARPDHQSIARRRVNILLFALREVCIPEPVLEYRFDAVRKWRFDIAWPSARLALEIDGGNRIGGRHTQQGDYDKLNAAAVQGWRVLRFTGEYVDKNPLDVAFIVKEALSWRL